MTKKIEAGSRVLLHFDLTLKDGTVLESTWQREAPAPFTMGDGKLPGEIESLLLGLEEGSGASFELPPEVIFGEGDPMNIKQLSKSQFPSDIDLTPGLVVSFRDPAGQEVPGTVVAINDDLVTVDFNPVLVGQSATLKVEIVAIDGDF